MENICCQCINNVIKLCYYLADLFLCFQVLTAYRMIVSTFFMNKRIVLGMLDRSFPTQTVYEGRGPEESGDDDGLHSHFVLMEG